MPKSASAKLARLTRENLSFNRGIEREALRVDLDGNLAQSLHPKFLGSKLTHPMITTDFSEAQLELITPVKSSIDECLSTLTDIHRFIYSGLSDELLWSSSMPCMVPEDKKIPLAQYGNSNVGKLKTTYRHGLGIRYGRAMQTICAIHYNFSFTDEFWMELKEIEQSTEALKDFKSRRYFDLMRNFRRFSWLLVYLFGASPAVCKSFLPADAEHTLEDLDYGSLGHANATSLRNGDLGYQSHTQSNLIDICYNSLENYVETLRTAICTPHPDHFHLAVDGIPHAQVSGNILQSEAEFYTTIRAKRVPGKGENFLNCLSAGGVEYLEVRLLDINPYLPLGIDAEEIQFLDDFLLYCLMADSPKHGDELCAAVHENIIKTVNAGRSQDLLLNDNGTQKSVQQWGNEILDAVAQVTEQLKDEVANKCIKAQRDKLLNPALTPSARILSDMNEQAIPFFRFAMNQAINHRDYFNSTQLAPEVLQRFVQMSEKSVVDQQVIEDSDELPFDEYLQQMLSEYQPKHS